MFEAAFFYETANVGLGDDFLDDVENAINSIRQWPEVGTEIADGFRRTLVRRFPFGIVYIVEPDCILVVAVAHLRRSPDYWKGRILRGSMDLGSD